MAYEVKSVALDELESKLRSECQPANGFSPLYKNRLEPLPVAVYPRRFHCNSKLRSRQCGTHSWHS